MCWKCPLVRTSNRALHVPPRGLIPWCGLVAAILWACGCTSRPASVVLYRLSTDGRGPAAAPEPLPGAHNTFPRFSPDGAHLAFVSDRSGTPELWVGDAEGRKARRLTHLDGVAPAFPRWAPDGQRLAFEAARPGHPPDVYVVAVTGGPVRRLTDDDARDTRPAWSPDGRRLVFASDRSGRWAVWQVPAGGGPAVPLADDATRPFLSPDGYLYYRRPGSADVWRLSPAGGEAELVLDLLPPTQADSWTLTPSGLHFVYYDALTGPHLATFDPASGRLTLRTPLPVLPENGSLTVSPDGQWYALAHRTATAGDAH